MHIIVFKLIFQKKFSQSLLDIKSYLRINSFIGKSVWCIAQSLSRITIALNDILGRVLQVVLEYETFKTIGKFHFLDFHISHYIDLSCFLSEVMQLFHNSWRQV